MNKPLILVVEDDPAVARLISTTLETRNYQYHRVQNGAGALLEAASARPDVILLDLGLPDMDGIDVIRKIRGWSNVPILVVSARSDDTDKVSALDAGADDYLTKPFALEELEARVRTLLRREFRQRESLVQVGALTLNTVTREVSGRGEPLPLTPREFAILEHLMLHRGCWISQEELMEHIWEADANPFSNAVRMHISSLRKKLRKRLGHDPIQTKVGRGYRLAGEETA